jgi:hypothetical protein
VPRTTRTTRARPTGQRPLPKPAATRRAALSTRRSTPHDVPSAFTYEAWIDASEGIGSGVYTVLGKPYGGGDTDSVAVWFQGGTLYAAVNSASTSGALSYVWSFAAGTWHHVAFT